jgi:Ca-activated chloride channel family protein
VSRFFIWPSVLWALALVPAFIALYVRALRRRPKASVSYPNFALLAAAAAQAGAWRHHLAAALFLLAVTAIALAVARPLAWIPVPAEHTAIMLAVDTSGSMRSQDIHPNRLVAAQEAAKMFLKTVPADVPVGLVAFGGFATLLSPPTTDRKRVFDAIDTFYFLRRTAIGDGLLEAMAALPGRAKPQPDGTVPPKPPGGWPPGYIILLSDGRSNSGMDPVQAAGIARQQGVVVYSIGVGSTDPGAGWTLGGTLDDEELQAIAKETGGMYFHAKSAAGLQNVYRHLARTLAWDYRPEEVTSMAGMLAMIALIAAVVVSRSATHPVGI